VLFPTNALPRYRIHAAPSGPWPWIDFSNVDIPAPSTAVTTVAADVATDKPDATTAVTDASTATKWSGYPQNLFGNWTPDQVQRSQMLKKCSKNQSSIIYWMDVLDDGRFTTPDMTTTITNNSENEFWNLLQGEASIIRPLHISDITWDLQRPEGIRVRSLFVDNLTPSVLRMLGTKYGVSFACLLTLMAISRYNIEPFFFTSSANWIPSRYKEAPIHGQGDRKSRLLFWLIG